MHSACLFGVRSLHHGGGAVGVGAGVAVEFADAGIAAENVGMAVFAAEDGPFIEDSKAVQCGRAAGTHHCIGQNPVEEGDVDAVVIPVKGHRFHVDVGIDQLCTADLDVSGAVQLGLGAIG